MQRNSVMIQIEGVDGTRPRLVARADMIDTFAEMAQSDLRQAHSDLGIDTSPPMLHFVRMEATGTATADGAGTRGRSTHAQALLAFRSGG
jgi:hypothetical protein